MPLHIVTLFWHLLFEYQCCVMAGKKMRYIAATNPFGGLVMDLCRHSEETPTCTLTMHCNCMRGLALNLYGNNYWSGLSLITLWFACLYVTYHDVRQRLAGTPTTQKDTLTCIYYTHSGILVVLY